MDDSTVVIAGAARTAMGGMNGALAGMAATQLGAEAIRAALARSGVAPEAVDEVLMGCVLPAGLKQAPARQAALGAGIPKSAGCTTINKVCGSGMQAVMFAHDQLKAGTNTIMVAGGMESMSNAPHMLLGARQGIRLGHAELKDHMFLDGLEDAYTARAMGSFAQETANERGITREQMDAYAIQSLTRALAAIEQGRFKDEIAPVTVKGRKGETVVDTDEQPLSARPDKIPQLKAAFAKDGTITAANSSSISDGGSALVLTTAGEATRSAACSRWRASWRTAAIRTSLQPVHHRTRVRDREAAREDRLERGRRGPVRDQRGLRDGGHDRDPRPRPRPGESERARRRLRAGPPAGLQRQPHHRHPAARAEASLRQKARHREPVYRRRRGNGGGDRDALIGVVVRSVASVRPTYNAPRRDPTEHTGPRYPRWRQAATGITRSTYWWSVRATAA
jgi:acetyl-CoA acetyltransferase family protein